MSTIDAAPAGVPAGTGPDALSATAAMSRGPRIFLDVLDHAFHLMRRALGTVVLITAVLVLPRELLVGYLDRNVLGVLTLETFLDDTAGLVALDQAGTTTNASVLVTFLTAILVAPVITLAVSRVVGAVGLGQPPPGTSGALAWALRRAGRAIGVSLLSGVVVVGPLVAAGAIAILGGITDAGVLLILGVVAALAGVGWALWSGPLVYLVLAIIAVEDIRAVAALRRSWRMVKPRWGRTLGLLVVGGIVVLLVSAALSSVPQLAGFFLGSSLNWIVFSIGAVLAALLTTPIAAALAVAVYLDVRIRDEGLDLQAVAAQLDARGR